MRLSFQIVGIEEDRGNSGLEFGAATDGYDLSVQRFEKAPPHRAAATAAPLVETCLLPAVNAPPPGNIAHRLPAA